MTYQLIVETVSRYAHLPEKGGAIAAAGARYGRLRGQGIKAVYVHGVTTAEITYTDPMNGDVHTLTYTEAETDK